MESDGPRFFVRMGADLPFYGVSRAREQAAARAAEAAGIGPVVRHTEADVMVAFQLHKIAIFFSKFFKHHKKTTIPAVFSPQVDFVEGSRALTEADLHEAGAEGPQSSILQSVGRALRRLHDIPVPPELEAMEKPYLVTRNLWFIYLEVSGSSKKLECFMILMLILDDFG